jgi:hypothetical protein
MGLVYCPLVRWTDGCFTAGPSDPMDDENALTLMEVLIDNE